MPGNGLNSERMKGLEPSTFCMAMTWRERTRGDRRRHFALLSGFLRVRNDTGSQQLTEKANRGANHPAQEGSRSEGVVGDGVFVG